MGETSTICYLYIIGCYNTHRRGYRQVKVMEAIDGMELRDEMNVESSNVSLQWSLTAVDLQ